MRLPIAGARGAVSCAMPRNEIALPEDLRTRTLFALEVAREAGNLTLSYFQSSNLQVDRKRDGTQVTAADRAAELLLRERLLARFPNDGVLGEEHGEVVGTSGLRWVLDPIDGTASFVCGVPLYSNLVALEHAGRTIVGVIHLPALGETVYAARGLGAWHSFGDTPARPARVSRTASLRESVVCTTSLDYFVRAGVPGLHDRVQASCALFRGWSDAYAAVLLATGRVDAFVEPKVALWDVAAVQVVVEEAGGAYTDFSGGTNLSAGNCIASNGLVHHELLNLITTHNT